MHQIVLHAGPLQLVLNSHEGSLRYIYAGQHEVLRGISAPVRDEAWATVAPAISDLRVDQRENSFEVHFAARCQSSRVDFSWLGKIAGAPDGTLVFEFNGKALGDFHRNRIGFCVLHGSQVSGTSCTVEQENGSKEQGGFPEIIHPAAPFSRIRAIVHRITPELEAEVRFEGEIFEMEDQRNWTDASFKTYCTPLALPRPVFVAKGTRIAQRVTLRLNGTAEKKSAGFSPPWHVPDETDVTIVGALGWKLPALGTVWNRNTEPTDTVVANLRLLSLAHLRVDLWLNDSGQLDQLKSAAAVANKLKVALEIALFVDNDPTRQIKHLLTKLAEITPAPRIARWLVFHQDAEATPASAVIAARDALAGSTFVAPVGGGSADNYAELNHDPTVATAGDFTVHACNPQVHASDEASIVETIPQQRVTLANARHLSGGKPALISPVTLTRRWRLNEPGAPTGLPARILPFQTDLRQDGPFAAAWSLASLASLAQAGATSVTYYETMNENGLLRTDGTPRPLHAIFAAIAPFSGGSVFATNVSHALSIAALALACDNKRVLFLANLRSETQRVNVSGTWGRQALSISPYGFTAISFA